MQIMRALIVALVVGTVSGLCLGGRSDEAGLFFLMIGAPALFMLVLEHFERTRAERDARKERQRWIRERSRR